MISNRLQNSMQKALPKSSSQGNFKVKALSSYYFPKNNAINTL